MRTSPFKSQLIPHFQTIREMRRHRKTWREIAELLKPMGVETSGSNVFQFFKRHCRRPRPLGMESETGTPNPTPLTPKWMKEEDEPIDLDLSFKDPLDEFVKLPPKKD